MPRARPNTAAAADVGLEITPSLPILTIMSVTLNKPKAKRSPFGGYRAFVSELRGLTRQARDGGDWDERAAAALNGKASAELRRATSLETRRRFGAFFTGTELSARLLSHCASFDETSVAYDPACGMGDLLLAAAKKLPLGRTLADTLRGWSRQL